MINKGDRFKHKDIRDVVFTVTGITDFGQILLTDLKNGGSPVPVSESQIQNLYRKVTE